MFRGFSKSKSDRSSHSSSHSRRESEPKTELAITAPRQIVKALYPYKAERPEELSFEKNDFFYVNDEPAGEWYVASNPLKNSRGLVPMSYFEVVRRHDIHAVPVSQARRPHSRSHSSIPESSGNLASSPTGGASGSRGSVRKSLNSPGGGGSGRKSIPLTIYGFVLYDFQAERNDELSVTAGESIVIVAQSTEEWFVAKPIGRLGGPGLIPVTYVELREVGTDRVLTDVHDAIKRASLPQVDEWKRKLAEYKASSIPLGRFGTTSDQVETTSGSAASVRAHSRNISNAMSARSDHSAQYSQDHDDNYRNFVSNEPYVVCANVDRFAINGGRYWYLVKVEMSNGRHRNLCRYYQDFYDFQIKLLEQFPVEAGRTGRVRTLPFMPGPLTLITHTVTSQRRANLDEYVRDLIRMPPYISQSPVVLDLFGIHPGDIESDSPTDEVPHPLTDDGSVNYSGDMPENDDASESSNTTRTFHVNDRNEPGTPTATTHNLIDSGFDDQSTSANDHSVYLPVTPPPENQGAYSRPIGELEAGSVSTATVDDMYSQQVSTHPYGERNASLGRNAVPCYKIKVYAHDEVFAMRMPVESNFEEVYEKIATRLGIASPQLYSSPEFAGSPITDASNFIQALNGGTKLALYLGP